MTFAVTSKGFFKNKIMTTHHESVSFELIWTDKLREAKQFKSRSSVEKFLKVNGLEGFVYNPKEQEPIRHKYRVIKRHAAVFRDENDLVYEWIVEKALMISNSDINFLIGKDNTDLYDIEEAKKIAYERNRAMLLELIYKLKLAKKEII